MKQFDDIFRENVNEAFNKYDASHLADEGWKSFIATKPSRLRMLILLPLWAKAASVAVIVGLGAFTIYHTFKVHSEGEMLTNKAALPEKEVVVAANPASVEPVIPQRTPDLAGNRNAGESTIHSEPQSIAGNPSLKSAYKDQGMDHHNTGYSTVSEALSQAARDKEIRLVPVKKLNSKSPSIYGLRKSVAQDMENPGIAENEILKDKTRLMAGMSGQLGGGSDDGTTGVQGMSVGFFVDHRLTRRISLRPGLALAVNTVGVGNNSGGGKAMTANFAQYDGLSGTINSYEGHLSMLAMEIPLNVVFTVLERNKSGLYLATGASTMIYLNQQFEADIVNGNTVMVTDQLTGLTSSETILNTLSVKNDYDAFSRTDILGLANISAGYYMPYSKTGTLIIEPFLQMPLEDLTSLNLRIMYGGISVKFRFGRESE